jgi:hypothetical protein
LAITGSLNTAKFTKGRGLLYLECGVPSADTRLATTAGVPTTAHMAGYTEEGNTITIGYEQEEVNADEATTAVETIISAENLTIAGSAMQLEDVTLLQKLLGTGTYSDKTTYDLIKFGGLTSLTDAGTIGGVLLVWVRKDVSDDYVQFQLYDAINQAENSWQVTKTKYGAMAYNFKGRPVTSRAVGDQIGSWAIDK